MRLVVAANATDEDMDIAYSGTDVMTGKTFEGVVPSQSSVVISCN